SPARLRMRTARRTTLECEARTRSDCGKHGATREPGGAERHRPRIGARSSRCSVGCHPAAGVAGALELAAKAQGRLARARRAGDGPIPYALLAQVGLLHVGCLAAQHVAVLLLHV